MTQTSIPFSDLPPHPRPGARTALGRTALAGLLALAGAATALAAPPLDLVDECLETSTGLVNLPAAEGGWLNVAQCPDCQALRLNFADTTRYFVGKTQASYAELRAALGWESAPLLVCYEPASATLTRLSTPAPASQP